MKKFHLMKTGALKKGNQSVIVERPSKTSALVKYLIEKKKPLESEHWEKKKT